MLILLAKTVPRLLVIPIHLSVNLTLLLHDRKDVVQHTDYIEQFGGVKVPDIPLLEGIPVFVHHIEIGYPFDYLDVIDEQSRAIAVSVYTQEVVSIYPTIGVEGYIDGVLGLVRVNLEDVPDDVLRHIPEFRIDGDYLVNDVVNLFAIHTLEFNGYTTITAISVPNWKKLGAL